VTVETAAAKATAKTIALLVLIVIVLIGVGVAWWHWKDYQALKTYREATESRQETTGEIDKGLSAAQDSVSTVRIQVEQSRSESDRRYQEVMRNDQTAKSWADTPLPDSVRDLDADTVDRP